jgi:serine phosphatase RsbU (regulator of sigma subunit)
MLLPAAPFASSAPRAARNVPQWNVDLLNSPAGGARYGGDWCDVFAISGNSIAVTIGDVAGHGEPVAETMHVMRQAVFAAMKDSADPSTVLSVANSAAYSQGDGVIVTAIVAILNRGLQTLTFANAGHPAPFMMTAAAHGFLGSAVGDLPLGVVRKHRAADYVIALPPDALIVMYTDGVTEHDRNILCGERELVGACRAAYDAPGSDAACAIARRVFGETRGHDDAVVIALRASNRTTS